jgi:hypothetical protein
MYKKNVKTIVFISILVIVLILASGCTSTPSQPPGTPTKTFTHTPTKTPTPTITPTPTPIQKTVLFSDDLSRWRSDWDSEYNGPSGKIFYSGGALHIRDINPPDGMLYQELNKKYSDFTVDVDMTMVDGTIDNWQSVGVRCKDLDNYYHLSISADGYYAIIKWQNGIRYCLSGTGPIRSSYIKTGVGETNHVHGEANKNTLSLFVNGHHLSTVTDSSFREGTLDLSVNAMSPNSFSEVAFKNFIISSI